MINEKQKIKIGIISVRLGGLDGVSLEVDKWVKVLKEMGYEIFLATGEVVSSPYGYNQITGKRYDELIKAKIISEMAIENKVNQSIKEGIFVKKGSNFNEIEREINETADIIEKKLARWIKGNKLRIIIVENVNCLPVNIPLAVAVGRILNKNPDIKFIFHHHDFYWERERYKLKNRSIIKYLNKYFPPQAPNAKHIVINSLAQRELFLRKRIKSVIIPNVFSKEPVTKKDKYNNDFRKRIGVKPEDFIFLVPVRIVPRKNIEQAIELIKKIRENNVKLIIAGCPDFNSGNYLKELERLSQPIKEKVKFVCRDISPRRVVKEKKKKYTIFDVYAHSDFVIYPVLYEGWGNALGEAMMAGLPVLVNRYKIFKADIERRGFELVKINNGKINKKAIKEVEEILANRKIREKIVKKNRRLMEKYYSLEKLKEIFKQIL